MCKTWYGGGRDNNMMTKSQSILTLLLISLVKLNVCDIDPNCPIEGHHPHHKAFSGYCHSCPRCKDWDPSDVKSSLGKYCSHVESLQQNGGASNHANNGENNDGSNGMGDGNGSNGMSDGSSNYSDNATGGTSSNESSSSSSNNGSNNNNSANNQSSGSSSSNMNDASDTNSASNSQGSSSNSANSGNTYNEATGNYQNRNSDGQWQGYDNESISYVSSSSSSSSKNGEASNTDTTSHSQHSAADDSELGTRVHTTYAVVNKRARRLKIFLISTLALSFLIFASSTFIVLKVSILPKKVSCFLIRYASEQCFSFLLFSPDESVGSRTSSSHQSNTSLCPCPRSNTTRES